MPLYDARIETPCMQGKRAALYRRSLARRKLGGDRRGRLEALSGHGLNGFQVRATERFSMQHITVNGEARQLSRPMTVLDLLGELTLVGKRLAVERNGEIVPRGRHADTALQDGDRIEIVVAVGGG